MFDFLKKRLKGSVKRLAKTAKGEEKAEPKQAKKKPAKPEITERAPAKQVKQPKIGFRERIKKRITEKKLTEDDIDSFFRETELDMLRANVALEVVDFLKSSLKDKLTRKEIKTSRKA